MYEIELEKAKTQSGALIQTALDGQEVVITRNDEPVLKLAPVSKPSGRRKAGSARGLITIAEDFKKGHATGLVAGVRH